MPDPKAFVMESLSSGIGESSITVLNWGAVMALALGASPLLLLLALAADPGASDLCTALFLLCRVRVGAG